MIRRVGGGVSGGGSIEVFELVNGAFNQKTSSFRLKSLLIAQKLLIS